MTEKTAKKIEGMKNNTIGVEIEMNNITRENAAIIAARFFGTHRYENTAYRNGYCTWSAWDSEGREWKFQRDSSISGIDSEKCELVTPILKYKDIETLQELCRKLRKAGAKSDPTRGCGVHIHIGASGMTVQSIKNLVNIMASHERAISEVIGVTSYRSETYCRPVNRSFLKSLNEKKPQTMEELADIWYESHGCSYGRNEHYNHSRYHMLNLHATFTKGTIEFRCFQFDSPDGEKQNGIHAGLLKSYIQLCLAMVQRAKTCKFARNADILDSDVCSPYAIMAYWLKTLGMVGDEFETARKLLTRNLSKVSRREALTA